jgi:hypothetical protein
LDDFSIRYVNLLYRLNKKMSKRFREEGYEEEQALYCPSETGASSSSCGAPQLVTIVRSIGPQIVLIRLQGQEIQVPRSSLQPVSQIRLNAEEEARRAWNSEDYEVFEHLVRTYGVDPNPFLWRASLQQLKLLLKLGANPNRLNHAGLSLLRIEAQVGARVEIVRLLLEAGARDPSALPGTVRTAISALFLEENEEPLFTNALATIALLRMVASSQELEAARAQLAGPEWDQIKSSPKGLRIMEALS